VEIESDFRHPPLRATARSLAAHFRSPAARIRAPLRNPHHESKVSRAARARATPAAVLIPIVLGRPEASLLLTRRHAAISFPGHSAFPGGRCDPADGSPEETALREAEEEIALDRGRVRVLGRLGDYVTHSGFRITPVVALVDPPLALAPREGEVEAIFEVPLRIALDARSYRLRGTPGGERAHFFLAHEGHDIAGPTVALLMGLYEELLKSHSSGEIR
jgi:8-oxo-dGTP pyrophosphatase MutT (NUDIX family)